MNLHNFYEARVAPSGIYGTRENRKYLQGEGIRFGGKPLGRPMKHTAQNAGQIKLEKKQRKQDALERIPIEGKFWQGKNGYRLNYIRAKTAATSEAWIRAIFLVMNLMVLIRCWCVFYFGAMKTRISQFFYDQFALSRHGLDRCLDQGWSSAHFKMIF